MNVTVLGTGLVGRAMVRDLSLDENLTVTAVDASPDALAPLQHEVRTRVADLRDPDVVAHALQDTDLAVLAVPGYMGFETLRSVIETGTDVVDISFFPEDAFALDESARERGVTAVVDCGVAPGLCNLMAGRVDAASDALERYACYVGGLPVTPAWPYGYKAVFSPIDVLEEYTRPARLVHDGKEVVRPALSEVEHLEFEGVGTLEAFNTDGLRSLIHTLDAPFMIEKTLRFPGHAELMRVFRETGFFAKEPVALGDEHVAPIDLTARLLFDAWNMDAHDRDQTILRVVLESRTDGRRSRHTFDLLDRFDEATGTSSMARTTGYTCTLVARAVADGSYARPGISPPEFLGRVPGMYDRILKGYAARGIHVAERVEALD